MLNRPKKAVDTWQIKADIWVNEWPIFTTSCEIIINKSMNLENDLMS